jgi:hypothetical protein
VSDIVVIARAVDVQLSVLPLSKHAAMQIVASAVDRRQRSSAFHVAELEQPCPRAKLRDRMHLPDGFHAPAGDSAQTRSRHAALIALGSIL